MILVGTGAAALSQAWIGEHVALYFVGWIGLLTGSALVLSGCLAHAISDATSRGAAPPQRTSGRRRRQTPVEEHKSVVPLLGELLVHKYEVITQQQLNRALEQQLREHKSKPCLGVVLVGMGLVTPAQLQQALEDQRWHSHDRDEAEAQEISL
jgi:hypothetical protein